jgi:hypothetical protein
MRAGHAFSLPGPAALFLRSQAGGKNRRPRPYDVEKIKTDIRDAIWVKSGIRALIWEKSRKTSRKCAKTLISVFNWLKTVIKALFFKKKDNIACF